MNKISLFLFLSFCSLVTLQTGCHAGGERLLGSTATPNVNADVTRGRPTATSVNGQKEEAGDGEVILTAAKTAQHSQGPALITLAAGDDLRRYLEGSHRRVILDFYADWCGPCVQQGRVLHEVEHVASDANALIVKINVDQHQELAESFSVNTLPTLMVYGDRQLLQRRTGLTSASTLKNWVR